MAKMRPQITTSSGHKFWVIETQGEAAPLTEQTGIPTLNHREINSLRKTLDGQMLSPTMTQAIHDIKTILGGEVVAARKLSND